MFIFIYIWFILPGYKKQQGLGNYIKVLISFSVFMHTWEGQFVVILEIPTLKGGPGRRRAYGRGTPLRENGRPHWMYCFSGSIQASSWRGLQVPKVGSQGVVLSLFSQERARVCKQPAGAVGEAPLLTHQGQEQIPLAKWQTVFKSLAEVIQSNPSEIEHTLEKALHFRKEEDFPHLLQGGGYRERGGKKDRPS